MIIFLCGQDTYRSRQKLNEIVAHYKKIHKSGLNLRYFDFEKENFPGFQDEIKSTSMFKEKKLVVLRNTFSNENFKLNFLKNSKKFIDSPDIFLFYEEGKVPEDEFFKFLKKHGKSQEFKLLEDQKLRDWVKKEFENYGASHQTTTHPPHPPAPHSVRSGPLKLGAGQEKITPEALNQLINFVGNNLWQMSNEIKKLVNYKKGKKIEVKDVELLVRPKIEIDIFKTIDAIALKNKTKALELIHRHLEKGDSPLYLLGMINFQFRNLLMVKSGQLGYETTTHLPHPPKPSAWAPLRMHPYVIRKTTQQARRFTLNELKKIYQKIFEVDLEIKTGKIEPETALDLLIAEI